VVTGIDRRDSGLLLSFIVSELWYGCCFLSAQSFVFPKKLVPIVSRSPHEAEIGPVFVLYPAVFFLVVLVVELAAGAAGADYGCTSHRGEGREAGVRTQQEWISRNCDWKSWTGSNWNMVFVGVVHPPEGALGDHGAISHVIDDTGEATAIHPRVTPKVTDFPRVSAE